MDPLEVLTRQSDRPDAVVRYGDHPDQLLDVHLPADVDRRAPVVVLVHGGFWRQAHDRTHTRPLAQALVVNGWAVVNVEYRRTGGAGGRPETFDDVSAALDHVATLDEVAPGRLALDGVTLLGHSAGGHLVMWLALRPDAPPSPRVRHVVALAPVSDLREAYARRLGDGAVEALMGGGPRELSDEYAAADPAGMLPGQVAVTVVHGDEDQQVPVEMSRDLQGVDYVELRGVEHFGLIDPLSSAWPDVLHAVGRSQR